MSDPYLDDLCEQLARGNVVVIVGAGVAVAATAANEAASWSGLLRCGIRRLRQRHHHDDAWERERLAQLQQGDAATLIALAEEITQGLGGLQGGDFGNWLRETVGALRVEDDALLKALVELRAPLWTTNYDSLLEQATGRPVYTWLQKPKIDRVLRGDDAAIVHLHGHWDLPQTVVLGIASYEQICRDPGAQARLQAVLATKTCLFVGMGEGLSDPNFSALLAWFQTAFADSPYPHYVLARDDEAPASSRDIPSPSALLFGPMDPRMTI